MLTDAPNRPLSSHGERARTPGAEAISTKWRSCSEAEVERPRGQEEAIATLMESKRAVFVEMAGAALEQLERMESCTGGGLRSRAA
jgi:hypothetical protein